MTTASSMPVEASSAATEARAREATPRNWPRAHLIYYLLATLNILAILAGLMFSHWIMQRYESGLKATAEYDRQLVSIRMISGSATEAQASLIDSLHSGDIDSNRLAFRTKSVELRQEVQRLREQVGGTLSKAAKARHAAILTRLDSSIAAMERHALAAFDHMQAGRTAEAISELGRLQSRYATMRRADSDLVQFAALIRAGKLEQEIRSLAALRNYEIAIGALIVLIIGCVVLYGHYITRLLKWKYLELETALDRSTEAEAAARRYGDQLNAINGDVVRLNRELESNLTKLRDAQDDLLRKSRLSQLGQLTATVAHELRNPLGAVRTSTFLLERKLKDKGLGVEAQIERINNGVTRCDGIISQLLDFTRTKNLQRDRLVLDEWLATLLQEQAEQLPEQIAVECHLGLGPLEVWFDPARMSRVLINLVSNAAEAMTTRTEEASKPATVQPRIVVRSALTGRGIEISVEDNGPGIPDEVLGKIMEPLFTTKSFGTGLGLPAVEKILEQHGGGLDIASRIGEGARFTAWWPLSNEKQEVA